MHINSIIFILFSLFIKSIESYPYFPLCLSFDSNATILNTLNGQVKGRCSNITIKYATKPTEYKPIVSFLGIPYAQPPIGNLRFKNPLPANSWNDTLDGNKLPNRCIQQPSISLLNQSEDCLFLNVFVPYKIYFNAVVLKNDSFKAPVYVYIHGGYLLVGSSLQEYHEPSTFVAMTDVIVVNINYRLGVFGFFYMNGTDAYGNQGIFDQSLALKWVYDNANSFGGDKTKITIGGQSAGAFSVAFHLVFNQSWSYFSSAIIESGNLLDHNNTLLSTDEATRRSNIITNRVNCSNYTNEQTLQCMRQISNSSLILEASYTILNYPLMVLDNIYITSQPSESFLNGNFKNVNLLIGSNTNEAAFFAVNLAQLSLLSIGNFDFFKYLLNFYYSAYQFLNQNQSVSFQNIIQLYIPTDVLNDNTTNYLDYIFQIGTDSSFKCPTIKLADYESQVNPNVYVYSYGYQISSSPYSSKYEAVHSEELYMVYAEPLSVKILPLLDESVYSSVYNNYSAYERNISETIVNYWGNFIKNQKPTLSTDEWPQFKNRNGDPINRSIKSLNGNESNVFNFQLNDTKYLFWTTGNTNTSTAPTTTTLSSTTMKGSATASLSIKLQVFYLEFLFFLLFLF